MLAYQVAQRRKEIGIRMALGSDGRRIFGLIVSEGLRLLCLGVGLAGAFAIRRAMETQLFGVRPMIRSCSPSSPASSASSPCWRARYPPAAPRESIR